MTAAPTRSELANDAQRGSHCGCSDLLAVKANDSQKETLHELHLFAGAGGGILGGLLLGHEPVCAVELEPAARNMLLQRQRDGVLPRFPIWDNVTTFDGSPWRGKVDVVCSGYPGSTTSGVKCLAVEMKHASGNENTVLLSLNGAAALVILLGDALSQRNVEMSDRREKNQ